MGLNLCDRCAADCRHERNPNEIVVECGAFKPPMTNSDRIRAMSDEELAEYLCGLTYCCECEHRDTCNGEDGYLKWLRQPAEDCEACHDGVCDIPGVIVQDEATEFTRVQWDWLMGRFTRKED